MVDKPAEHTDDQGESDADGESRPPGKVQVINPPNLIATKVSGGGGPTPEMLEKAEEAIAKMSDEYPAWAMKDIESLTNLLDEAELEEAKRIENLEAIFQIAHDMRGQGGSFGYPLMTRVGSSLCRFTEVLNNPDNRGLVVVRAHIDAMRAVIGNKVKGDGGRVGRQIARGLEMAVEKFQKELAQ